MRRSGTRILDPVLDHRQVDWRLVPAEECPDAEAEADIIRRFFRTPHEPWGPHGAYVEPVQVRRTGRWVLFRQASGLLE